MTSIGVKELRDNLSRFIKRVERGEVIRVLRHGKRVLELRPIIKSAEQNFVDRLKKKGIVSGGSGKISSVKSVKNLKPEKPVSDIIIEDRK